MKKKTVKSQKPRNYVVGKGKPPIEHRIKPGQVLNPEGGRAHDPEKRALKKLTQEVFKDIVELALTSNITALQAIAKNPETPSVKVGVTTALVKAIQRGDWKTLEGIVARLIGNVKIEVDHTTAGRPIESNTQAVHVYLPANGRTKEENGAK